MAILALIWLFLACFALVALVITIIGIVNRSRVVIVIAGLSTLAAATLCLMITFTDWGSPPDEHGPEPAVEDIVGTYRGSRDGLERFGLPSSVESEIILRKDGTLTIANVPDGSGKLISGEGTWSLEKSGGLTGWLLGINYKRANSTIRLPTDGGTVATILGEKPPYKLEFQFVGSDRVYNMDLVKIADVSK